MTILDDQRAEIVRRVAELGIGAEFSLRTLYDDDFEAIGTAGQRKHLGVLFRAAVINGDEDFRNIAYLEHRQSPAQHWYQRVR